MVNEIFSCACFGTQQKRISDSLGRVLYLIYKVMVPMLVVTVVVWGGPSITHGAEKVVLQLRWDHQFQFAGYYAALWQGYYQEAGIDHLIEGRVDVILGYSIAFPFAARVRGVEIRELRPTTYGVDFYGDSLFTSREYLKSNNKSTLRFKQATLKGWEYAMENADVIGDRISTTLHRYNPGLNIREFNRFQQQGVKRLLIYPLVDIGHTNVSRWQRMHGLLKHMGIVSTSFNPDQYFFDPQKDQQNTRQLMIYGLLLITFVSTVVGLLFFFWTRSLRRTVAHHTNELNGANAELLREIEDRRKIADDLKKSQELYRALFDHNPVQTVVVDTQGRILMFNFSDLKMEGKLPRKGQLMYREYADRHTLDMTDELMKCIASGQEKEFLEAKYKNKYLNIRISPFSGGAIITSIDITPLKQLAQQLQQAGKMKAIGTLAGGIAHDFNNILGIIMGNAELAMDGMQEENPVRLHLEEICTAGSRASDVVRHLLAYTHKTVDSCEPMLMNDVVESAMELMRASLSRAIDICLDIPETITPVNANPDQIKQVIINLCTNAAHAMEDKGGRLTVSLDDVFLETQIFEGYGTLEKGSYVRLSVTDTGQGIEPGMMQHIFDPYFTTKAVDKGTGMGLAIVHGIVKSHDGALAIESEPGRGTTVRILIPAMEERVCAEDIHPGDVLEGSGQILLVDDEPSLVKMGGMMLKRLGYEVTLFTDPVEALELFKSNPEGIDLVMTDMNMPVMNGDRLVKEILKIHPEIPVVICSGNNTADMPGRIPMEGNCLFMEKPYDRARLATVIQRALAGSI